jgi:hypothetical protein
LKQSWEDSCQNLLEEAYNLGCESNVYSSMGLWKKTVKFGKDVSRKDIYKNAMNYVGFIDKQISHVEDTLKNLKALRNKMHFSAQQIVKTKKVSE